MLCTLLASAKYIDTWIKFIIKVDHHLVSRVFRPITFVTIENVPCGIFCSFASPRAWNSQTKPGLFLVHKRYFCMVCTSVFHFLTYPGHFRLINEEKIFHLLCSCEDDMRTRRQIFSILFLSPDRTFQFYSQIVCTPNDLEQPTKNCVTF